MKIADSASAEQRSVTNVALIKSLPTFVRVRPRSTRTAYTTASDVVESAVPAISDALTVQPIAKYEMRDAVANGPAKDATPIATVIPSSTEMTEATRTTAASTRASWIGLTVTSYVASGDVR